MIGAKQPSPPPKPPKPTDRSVPDNLLDHRAGNSNAVPLGDDNPVVPPSLGEVEEATGERPSNLGGRGRLLDSPASPLSVPPAGTADPSVQVGSWDPDLGEDPYEQAARGQAKAAKQSIEALPFDVEPGSKVAW